MLTANSARELANKNSNIELKMCLEFLEYHIILKSEKGLKELILPNWLSFNGHPSTLESLVDSVATLKELGYDVLVDPNFPLSEKSKIYIRW